MVPFVPASAPVVAAWPRGHGSASVGWAAHDLGGGELVHYLVSVDGGVEREHAGPPVELTGLADGATHTVTVRAVTKAVDAPAGASTRGESATMDVTPGRAPTVSISGTATVDTTTVSVTFTVNSHSSGAVGCEVRVNGGRGWTGPCNGTVTRELGGLSPGTSHTIDVVAANGFGSDTSAPVEVSTAAVPPPPVVRIRNGGSAAEEPGCTSGNCWYVRAAGEYFPPGRTVTVQCVDEITGLFTSRDRTIGPDGTLAPFNACYSGYRSRIWVVVDGVESTRVEWPP